MEIDEQNKEKENCVFCCGKWTFSCFLLDVNSKSANADENYVVGKSVEMLKNLTLNSRKYLQWKQNAKSRLIRCHRTLNCSWFFWVLDLNFESWIWTDFHDFKLWIALISGWSSRGKKIMNFLICCRAFLCLHSWITIINLIKIYVWVPFNSGAK